jgi:hypothetical protein
MVIEEKIYLNHKVKLIHTNYGWTAQVQTDYGWYDLYTYYESKTQCRKALWYFIINH